VRFSSGRADGRHVPFFDHPLRSYLQKPFDDQTLRGRVRALLDAAQGAKDEAAHAPMLPGTAKPPGQT
jgi:DNA-binding response OmpR family regulator